jgi:EAL domain-containing protein (putative c-di-GMP-specific phosphodiesterase class I)
LLEETRLINKLGGWIFEQSANQRHRWKDVFDEDLIMSVSVSPAQFSMPNLAAELQRAIHLHGLHPRQLEVEITEPSLVHNLIHSRKQLQNLHDIGVRVSLDDFGAGESSLVHLRNLDLDTLKLDRHFIDGMLGSPRDLAVARSIIDLCRMLEIDVIAEGVETYEQYQWLVENGCQIIQGFLIAHPLPPEEAERFVDPVTLPVAPRQID